MNGNIKEVSLQNQFEDHRRIKRIIIFFTSIVLVVLSFYYGMSTGAISLSMQEIWDGLTVSESSMTHQIVWNLRLPRVLTGFLVGMCMAISGALLQGVTRNPLADPGIIGVSAGAGLVAIIVMIIFPQHVSFLPVGAFLGALLAATIVYLLAWNKGASPMRLILAGIAVNTLLGAITSGVMIIYSDSVQSVLPWLMGGLSDRSWPHFWIILPYAVIGITLSLFAAKPANILLLGDDTAKLLGHRVERSRLLLIILSTFLAGAAVSVSGLIGFVGLIVPHIVRLLIGDNYYYLLPISALTGGWLLVFADTAARSWFDPIELPVGILLAAIGGPFFLLLLRRGKILN
ncbi:FecCD family ABC transporter permease [Paenibacillus crassostreae]|uniref:Iron ABC transporter permease n=1 Tax=Paenibacillus crassostreae TaxID=1763538 RepID=A0A167FZR6_9BACL|nr:iron ABC transporter permease [Paenibacillus crassostreae]AOZ93906.1 iron ABC transporter permease [Paenibacillus crassostreae]OAB77062.1 iron ABC transporter permease [Paenibacillus crassostreae]